MKFSAFIAATLMSVILVRAVAAQAPAEAKAQAKGFSRKLVHPTDQKCLTPALKPYVEKLLANANPAQPDAVKSAGVFMRIVPERYVCSGGKVLEGARLGPRPFVFLSCPETLYGRSLLEIFAAIGYAPQDILENRQGDPHVAIIFTYPEDVTIHAGLDGRLPSAWQRRVYPTSWDNLFALVERLVDDKDYVAYDADKSFHPTKVILRSKKERAFVTSFPDAGKKRIKETPYATLCEVKGADWEYRLLLGRLTGAAEHFKGDGTSAFTLGQTEKLRKGFPEFLAPNAELQRVRDFAIIRLGALTVSE